jgi:hypothetical protein
MARLSTFQLSLRISSYSIVYLVSAWEKDGTDG